MTDALIAVGVDQYSSLPLLSGAENDARRVFDLLTGDDNCYALEHSRLLCSPTLSEFCDGLASLGDIEVITLFFAGHGGYASGNYFLCFADSVPGRLSTTAYPLSLFFAFLAESRPIQANIVLDSCQSAGAQYDLHGLLKREIIGHARGTSISFFAASAADEVAREEDGEGLATRGLLRYLSGERELQSTRPHISLVELGYAVSRDLEDRGQGQLPMTWGLNLFGEGRFASNPFFSPVEDGSRIPNTGVSPSSAAGKVIEAYSERLWHEYRSVPTDMDATRLIGLIQEMGDELKDPGALGQLVGGLARSFRSRAIKSENLFAESELHACCAVSLIPYIDEATVNNSVKEILANRAEQWPRECQQLAEQVAGDQFALLNPTGGHGEHFYLPLRITRVLGWLGANLAVDGLLGYDPDGLNHRAAKALRDSLLLVYGSSLVAMSDVQAPWVYAFARSCQQLDWEDTAKVVLTRLFESAVAARGRLAAPDLSQDDVLPFLIGRCTNHLDKTPGLLASPSTLLPVLLLLGADLGLADVWDPQLVALDGRWLNLYLPESYLSFGQRVMTAGTNLTHRIGHGVWSLSDLRKEYVAQARGFCEEESRHAELLSALCTLASLVLPDRVPFLFDLQGRH